MNRGNPVLATSLDDSKSADHPEETMAGHPDWGFLMLLTVAAFLVGMWAVCQLRAFGGSLAHVLLVAGILALLLRVMSGRKLA